MSRKNISKGMATNMVPKPENPLMKPVKKTATVIQMYICIETL